MKELYISPELEILCFLPMEGIATEPEWARGVGNLDEGLSTGESRPDDYNEDVTTPDL